MDLSLNPSSRQLNNGSKVDSRSFADAIKEVLKDGSSDIPKEVNLAGFSSIPSGFHNFSFNSSQCKDAAGFKTHTWRNDKPAIILTEREIDELSKPLQLTLIGKFPAGRPKWTEVQSVFKALKLKGDFRCINLDVRHIVIHLCNVEDYIRLFTKQAIFVQGFLLRFLKWTSDFSVNAESSFAPIWISFPMVRLYFYNHLMLYSLASVFGTPLKLDYATSHWLRPECARILVELDLRKNFDQELWIGTDNNGYMQQVIFENLPGFCSHCRKIGHYDSTCFYLHPDLKSKKISKRKQEIKKSGKDLVESSLRHDDLLSIKTGEILHQSVAQFDNNSFHEASARQKDHLDVSISHQELQNNAIVSSQAAVGNKEKPDIIVQPVQLQQILNNSGIDGFQNLVDKKGSEEIFNVNVDAVQNFECQTVSDNSEAQIVDGNLNTNVLNPVGDTTNDINSAVDNGQVQISNEVHVFNDINSDVVDVQFIQNDNVLKILSPFGYSEAIRDAPKKAINAAVNMISGKFPIMSNCPQGYVQLETKGFSQNHLDGVEKDVRLQHIENSVCEITDDIFSQSANLNEDIRINLFWLRLK